MKRAFVIAMTNEAEAVRPAVGPDDLFFVCGVGKVNAAAATQQAIDAGATEIVNAGVCGGFDPQMKVGDVFEVSSAVEYDFDLAQLNGTRVGQLDEMDTPYLPLAVSGKSPTRVLATGDRFNDSDDDLSVLSDLGCTLRDMEGAAIAHVCVKAGVTCRALKCVSDVKGRGSMTGQYCENLARCLECLRNAVISWI